MAGNQPAPQDNSKSGLADVLPGVAGGAVRVLVGQPFDIIKTRMQVLGRGSLASVGMPPHLVYDSSLDCVRKMVVFEGPMSLYKCTVAPLIGNMMLLGIHFPTFHVASRYIKQANSRQEFSYRDTWLAGAAAGAAGSVVACPAELVRTRMTMLARAALTAEASATNRHVAALAEPHMERYSSSLDCARQVLRRYGPGALYRGFLPTLLRDVQGYGCFFLAYEATIHALMKPGQKREELGAAQIISAGVAAGCCLWASMHPLDTLKSKLQADDLRRPRYLGLADCLARTLRTEGLLGLWRGCGAVIARAVPVNAAIFLAVEGSRSALAARGGRLELPGMLDSAASSLTPSSSM